MLHEDYDDDEASTRLVLPIAYELPSPHKAAVSTPPLQSPNPKWQPKTPKMKRPSVQVPDFPGRLSLPHLPPDRQKTTSRPKANLEERSKAVVSQRSSLQGPGVVKPSVRFQSPSKRLLSPQRFLSPPRRLAIPFPPRRPTPSLVGRGPSLPSKRVGGSKALSLPLPTCRPNPPLLMSSSRRRSTEGVDNSGTTESSSTDKSLSSSSSSPRKASVRNPLEKTMPMQPRLRMPFPSRRPSRPSPGLGSLPAQTHARRRPLPNCSSTTRVA